MNLHSQVFPSKLSFNGFGICTCVLQPKITNSNPTNTTFDNTVVCDPTSMTLQLASNQFISTQQWNTSKPLNTKPCQRCHKPINPLFSYKRTHACMHTNSDKGFQVRGAKV